MNFKKENHLDKDQQIWAIVYEDKLPDPMREHLSLCPKCRTAIEQQLELSRQRFASPDKQTVFDPTLPGTDQRIGVVHPSGQDELRIPASDLERVHSGTLLEGVEPVESGIHEHIQNGTNIAVGMQKHVLRTGLFVRRDHTAIGRQKNLLERGRTEHRAVVVGHIIVDPDARVLQRPPAYFLDTDGGQMIPYLVRDGLSQLVPRVLDRGRKPHIIQPKPTVLLHHPKRLPRPVQVSVDDSRGGRIVLHVGHLGSVG